VTSTPALSRGTLDRHGPERSDEAWLDAAWAGAQLLVLGEGNVTAVRYGSIAYAGATGPRPADALYLGGDAGGHVFAVHGEPGGRTADLRAVGADLDDRDAGALAHAAGLANWHRTHTHCPRCGAETTVSHGGAQRDCPNDGSHHFPRTDPAVIMLVHDAAEQRCLLGRQASWPPGRYSCLAGFVEPGESAEQAVVREVREESGVRCHTVRYGSSQPWPFPASLMLGYYAVADPSAPVTPTDGELEDAQWFARSAVLDGSVLLPPPVSVAYQLIMQWAR
jgi:NAD+ diphosphatase